ncbi:unnamed protein product [Caenorhabditis angaria]|uniref:L-type lectin-like domain-containing protein n=1 Tax=Caenorhabditis angaria TaxID=860376 RepID=A0A9P1I675_9PELO|nr:unnamed protein product [Caenorhabditis angaria]
MKRVSLGLLVILCLAGVGAQNNAIFKKFEYKHSFRAPNLAQRDGSIPFWIVSGDAIASGEQLRLAPSMRSRKGIAWNKRSFVESENFQIDVSLKIGGQGRVGADGLGIWYTSQLGALGPVFGANDFWTGMGLFLDSFDNDGLKNNPQVSLMLNDGTRSYDHHTDGSQQIVSSCQRDFRNKPYPVRVRIEYLKNVLTVHIDDGMQPTPRYELCMRAENIFLPRNGYFGVSAATGGLADDHDILDFSVSSLFGEQQKPQPAAQQIPLQEKQKYDEEFEKQMKEYEAEQAKFKEQHPDKVKENEYDDPTKFYEDATARELRLIYESQNAIHQVMQNMDQRLAQIQQTQLTGSAAVPQTTGGQQQQQVPVSGGGVASFQPHEKNEVIQSLRDLTQTIRDMKQYVNEIFTKTYNIDQKIQQGGAGGGGGADSELHSKVDSLLNELRVIRSTQVQQVSQPGKTGSATDCSNISCVSSTFFLAIIFVQSIIIVVVVFVRSKQDKAKFY